MSTEADTCRKFVVPKLKAAGWDSDPHSIAEQRSLNPQDFLDYEMPLPSMETQMTLRKVRAEVDALKRLQAETAAELDALLPAILDRAFKGEL
jgi:restriction endonuclease S subunit